MVEFLKGIRVLEVTSSLAGPYSTLILAAMGADVVKIEHPVRGDDSRSWGPPFWHGESVSFLSMNAGKRSVTLDLKSDADRGWLLELCGDVDVFVQNMRPGLVESLGLGFEQVRERKADIIYCTIGAYGSRGPQSLEPGYDALMQAASGIMSVTGEPDGPPVRAGVSVVDQGAGMWAALGIMAAIIRRQEEREAQFIETSLYETAVNLLPYQIVGFLADGVIPQRMGTALAMIAPYEVFKTADGEVMIAAGNDRQFEGLCDVLGEPALARDDRFRTNAARVASRDALSAIINARLGDKGAGDVVRRCRDRGVPAANVRNVAEVVNDIQTRELGLLQPVPHPRIPECQLVGLPLTVNGTRVSYRSAAPDLGADNGSIGRARVTRESTRGHRQ